ncbi:hypothetical protein PtA15_13A231 [Puccinia triticina]|uniref:tRNA(Phe) (4-demethylwyosine(37)-C(7)) aminocarboxypropyltransferase n=1 Tax=Puccinia triticina TaxID=208348 RepID=A0ABY7D2B8_9BASI|nr:uncharacterized protein PtA15_13A231 [Puccinia triticina]WAQ90832.1 hypothetical protein PtA15_13A231 [Puccinia triticina]
MAQVRADSDASAEATAPEPDGPEERLHAICGRESAHGLKLLLKRAALFAANRALIHEALGAERRQTVFIPTTATRLADPTHRPPEILPVDHPAIPLPPSFIAAASALLRGFQWIPLAGQPSHRSASPLVRAVQAFFGAQAAERLADELPRWEQYDDLVLFPPHAFRTAGFAGLDAARRAAFFAAVAAEFGVSRVARKGLIERADVARHPRLEPLHGVFRHRLSPDGRPCSLADVFWTATRFPTPHGLLHYVWAPSETMYCRGNSPEKRRIAALANVAGTVVVDMCCGIGFFAFGYLLAGAARVVGCEISPWAVEGLRRGAVLNRVPYEIVDPEAELTPDLLDASPARLLIFPAENARGLPLYRHRASHVNLGLLPSSLDFLPQAVLALRPEGGWIHIHAELAVPAGPPGRQHAAEQWAQQPRQLVLRLGRQSARVVDIHWIKSIGPAREHIVVELEVGPSKTST